MVSKRLGKSAVKKTETAYKLSYRLYGEKGWQMTVETALKAKRIVEQLNETNKIVKLLSTPFNKVEIFINKERFIYTEGIYDFMRNYYNERKCQLEKELEKLE